LLSTERLIAQNNFGAVTEWGSAINEQIKIYKKENYKKSN